MEQDDQDRLLIQEPQGIILLNLLDRMNIPLITRRDFLKIGWKSLLGIALSLGVAAIGKYLSYQGELPPINDFDLGDPGNYLPGTRTLIPDANAILINDDGEFKAISLICPHLGCVLEAGRNSGENGFACPCHGSRFDANGNLSHGPAAHPMTALTVEINSDQHLFVKTPNS